MACRLGPLATWSFTERCGLRDGGSDRGCSEQMGTGPRRVLVLGKAAQLQKVLLSKVTFSLAYCVWASPVLGTGRSPTPPCCPSGSSPAVVPSHGLNGAGGPSPGVRFHCCVFPVRNPVRNKLFTTGRGKNLVFWSQEATTCRCTSGTHVAPGVHPKAGKQGQHCPAWESHRCPGSPFAGLTSDLRVGWMSRVGQ